MTAHIENNWLATFDQLGKMVRVYYICCPGPEDINTFFLVNTHFCDVLKLGPYVLDVLEGHYDLCIIPSTSLGPYMHLGAAG